MDRYIDIEEVIATAATFLPEISDEVSLMMRQWVWMAMRDIGPNYNDIDTINISLQGGTAEKPADLTGNIIDMAVYSEAGVEIPHKYNYNADKMHEDDRRNRSTVSVYEDENYIHVSDYHIVPDYVRIRYFKMPLDDCGLPKIPENHLNSVVAYLLYCYHMRMQKDFAMIGFSKNQWLDERAKIRSKNKSISGVRVKSILKEWMTHIPKVNRNRF